MADYFVAAVRTDTIGAATIDNLASEIEAWLVADGVITMNTRYARPWHPSRWVPGPRWQSVVDDPAGFEHFTASANNGVDVVRERELHHPHQNVEPPRCPTCSARMDDDDYHAQIEGWLTGAEPSVQCGNCGTTSWLGDWPAEWGYAIGAPAVVFNNWPPLQDAFLVSVRALLGGRTYVVRARI